MRVPIVLVAVALACAPVSAEVAGGQAARSGRSSPGPERAATGSLDRVDVPAMQIVVATASGALTFRLQRDATIRQGSHTLTPAELARHRGERIKVRYREAAGERHTFLITLAAPAKKT